MMKSTSSITLIALVLAVTFFGAMPQLAVATELAPSNTCIDSDSWSSRPTLWADSGDSVRPVNDAQLPPFTPTSSLAAVAISVAPNNGGRLLAAPDTSAPIIRMPNALSSSLAANDFLLVGTPAVWLGFPLPNRSPFTATINSIFDHASTKRYCPDNRTVAYTGEEGRSSYGSSSWSTDLGCGALRGFKNSTGTPFVVNGNYGGGGEPNYLFYDGHPGWDFRTTDQAPSGRIDVLAAADGTAYLIADAFNTIRIDHGNSVESFYLHLYSRSVTNGQWVTRGQKIGTAGDAGAAGAPHLHFGVKVNGVDVDPYGWRGNYTDPYALNKNRWMWDPCNGSVPGNVDTDCDSDLFLRHSSAGHNVSLIMDGVTIASDRYINTVADSRWKIVGAGDFDTDGQADLAWRHDASGDIFIWVMDGTVLRTQVYITTVSDQNWRIVASADLNGDSHEDLLWWNRTTGALVIWLMKDFALQSQVSLGSVTDTTWAAVGAGDFDGDKDMDIVFRNSSSGANAVLYLQRLAVVGSAGLPSEPSRDWSIVAVTRSLGNADDDLVWQNTRTNAVRIWIMDGLTLRSSSSVPTLSSGWQVVGPK